MSDSDRVRASVVGAGCNDDDDDDKEGVGELGQRDGGKKKRGYGCGRDLRKVKQVVLFPFRKAKKKLDTRNNKRLSSSSSASACVAASASRSGERIGCYLCFTQPRQPSESLVDSPTSDPNSPQFSYECLRGLIEKNDFYSKDCNPHIHIIPSYQDSS